MRTVPSLLKNKFSQILLKWDRNDNNRQMPWKGEKDPYKVWLSEIILQQTRVGQGLSYYLKFINAFPTIHELAAAPDEKIFKLWEGLGYYSRCRNMISSARHIVNELNGEFPETFDEIKKLKGIGPYTAAAISSFAFNQPHAVVDGNVNRVLSRIFGIHVPVDTIKGKKIFSDLAEKLLDKKNPGLHNQAIMDFGATICKPMLPACSGCPFRKYCVAYLNNKINELPVKEKKTVQKQRWFYYFVLKNDTHQASSRIAIRKRIEKDIWQDLYEFPLVEVNNEMDISVVLEQAEQYIGLQKKDYTLITVSPLFKQQLTHQTISGKFITVQVSGNNGLKKNWMWVSKTELNQYAFPRYINQFLSRDQFTDGH